MKYSIGQKIRIIRAEDRQPYETVGKEGIIVAIDTDCDCYVINLIDEKYQQYNGYLFDDQDIEIIEEDK